MKTKSAKPALKALLSEKRVRNTREPRLAPVSNTALNQQSRRVLAQHYRAKYGVK